MRYLIAYDITDDVQRNATYKYLSGWGRRIQKSLFECDLKYEQLKAIVAYIEDLIDSETDRCHVYKVCAECIADRIVLGSDLEPDWGQTVDVWPTFRQGCFGYDG